MNAVTSDQRAADVRAYIGAVRAWLADLPAEDVEELTFGMEADLAERAAEGDVRLGDLLGEPEEYAAELRSAAGLPPRTTTVEGAASPGWFDTLAATTSEMGARALEQWPWLRDLRPVWWVTRGLVLGWAVSMVLGTSMWVLPVLAAAVSFAVGRALASRPRGAGVGVAATVANVVAALLLLPGVVSVLDEPADGPVDAWMPPGVSLDGSSVSDLYVYDSAGNRVEGARIFSPDGRGLFVDPGSVVGDDDVPLRPDGSPDVDTDVFPLVVGDRDPWGDPGTGWTPPLTLSPLPGATSTPVPSASPSAGPSPTVAPTPTATPTG